MFEHEIDFLKFDLGKGREGNTLNPETPQKFCINYSAKFSEELRHRCPHFIKEQR